MPRHAKMEDEYDSWHKGMSFGESGSEDNLQPWHRTVGRLLSAQAGSRILEVGCGRGAFAVSLARRFPDCDIHAVDFSSVAIAFARTRAGNSNPRLHFLVEDAEALSFEGETFDIVISCECLEHVPRPAVMAGEIRRVLRPGGTFILTTENYLNAMLLMWMKSWLTGVPIYTGSGAQPHENFFLYWRVKHLLEKNGLEVQHTESNYFQWLMLPRVDPGRLATMDFENRFVKRVVRPFGRHYTFMGRRPIDAKRA